VPGGDAEVSLVLHRPYAWSLVPMALAAPPLPLLCGQHMACIETSLQLDLRLGIFILQVFGLDDSVTDLVV